MYLWIDPWVRKLWYALINDDMKIIDAGILLQDKKDVSREDQYDRMVKIVDFFQTMFEKYQNQITSVGIEKLFFTKFNQNNAEFVYGIRGALITMMTRQWITIHEYSPIELKKNITGNGKAEKIMVQNIIMRLFRLEKLPEYDDAADALGLAYLASKAK